MATVTGFTAARMLEIEANSVVDGSVVDGDLILERQDSSTINAGSVVGPTGPTGAGFGASVLDDVTNLNTVITPGSYAQLVDAWATLALNYPAASDGGWLAVMGTGTNLIQKYTALHSVNTPMVYSRESSNSGSTWTTWRNIVMGNDSGEYRFTRNGVNTNIRITADGDIDSYSLLTETAPPSPSRNIWINAYSGGNVYLGKLDEITRNVYANMPLVARQNATFEKKIILTNTDDQTGSVEVPGGGLLRQSGSDGSIMIQYGGDTSNFCFITSDGSPQIRIPAAYSRTTGSAANVFVSSSGTFSRFTSLLKYKTNIEDAPEDWATKVLDLKPKTWLDKPNLDRYAAALSEQEETGIPINWDELEVHQIDQRFPGFIAEEVIEAGLDIFVSKDLDGTPNGLAYDRIVSALQMTVKNQQAQIDELKAQVATLMEG